MFILWPTNNPLPLQADKLQFHVQEQSRYGYETIPNHCCTIVTHWEREVAETSERKRLASKGLSRLIAMSVPLRPLIIYYCTIFCIFLYIRVYIVYRVYSFQPSLTRSTNYGVPLFRFLIPNNNFSFLIPPFACFIISVILYD